MGKNSSSNTDGSTLTLATGRSLFGCDREWSATLGCVSPAYLRARPPYLCPSRGPVSVYLAPLAQSVATPTDQR